MEGEGEWVEEAEGDVGLGVLWVSGGDGRWRWSGGGGGWGGGSVREYGDGGGDGGGVCDSGCVGE